MSKCETCIYNLLNKPYEEIPEHLRFYEIMTTVPRYIFCSDCKNENFSCLENGDKRSVNKENGMRNIHLIERFMEENNLKYDEPFIIKWKWFKEYKEIQKKGIVKIIKRICNGKSFVSIVSIEGFDDSENRWKDDREDMSNPLDEDKLLYDIVFNDTVQVVKIPFKPKTGEEYYRIVRGWDIIKDTFSESNDCDCAFFLIGNCFRTREEAEANLEKIKKLCKRNKPLIDLNEVE